MQVKLVPRDQRTRTSDEIAQDLRRRLSGIPGAIVRTNPGGGNFQLNQILGRRAGRAPLPRDSRP
jgi:HAE1 family hydrophobic/amphiphilic exporter-1